MYDGLGDRAQALTYYQQALPIRREVGDRAGEATTLNNIGAVYDGLGDRAQALTYYQQALPIRREVGDRAGEAATLNNIGARVRRAGGPGAGPHLLPAGPPHPPGGRRPRRRSHHPQQHRPRVRRAGRPGSRPSPTTSRPYPSVREVGDRAGEAVTRYNIAMIHRADGDLDRAISELELVVDLDRQVGHPDLESDTATLERVRRERTQSRPRVPRERWWRRRRS